MLIFTYILLRFTLILLLFRVGVGFGRYEEEHRLRVFENRVLRKVCGPKKEELKGQWIKLHREEDMFCTAHQIFLG